MKATKAKLQRAFVAIPFKTTNSLSNVYDSATSHNLAPICEKFFEKDRAV